MIGITNISSTSSSIVVDTIEMTTKGGWKYYGAGGGGRLVLHHGDFSIHVASLLVWIGCLVGCLLAKLVDVRCID